MSHSIRVRAYIASDRNEISLRRVGDGDVMGWGCDCDGFVCCTSKEISDEQTFQITSH